MRRLLKLFRELIHSFLIGIFIFLCVSMSTQNFRVEGESMAPTIKPNDRIFIDKISYVRLNFKKLGASLPFIEFNDKVLFAFDPPKRGDILVFQYPENPSRNFIKRIIGLPGETVEIKNGIVRINGVILQEPYVMKNYTQDFISIRVPSKSYFVLGDNRQVSNDSRRWGVVPLTHAVGKTWIRYWPISQLSTSIE